MIEGVEADLLLVTHEHLDHNGVAAIGGAPATLRSTAGRLESPIGEVLAVASRTARRGHRRCNRKNEQKALELLGLA